MGSVAGRAFWFRAYPFALEGKLVEIIGRVYLLLVCCKEDELISSALAEPPPLRPTPLVEVVVTGIGRDCCAIEAEAGDPATTDAHDELGLTAGRRVEPPDDVL